MKRTLIALCTVSLSAVACSQAAAPSPETPADVEHASSAKSAKKSKQAAKDPTIANELNPIAARDVGEFVVQRFSGSFRSQALMLTEEVVAKSGSSVTIEYTLEDGKQKTAFSVEYSTADASMIKVEKIDGEARIPATASDFEAMLAKTAFAPDQNVETVDKKTITCLVGGDEHQCDKVEYKVLIGDKSATLSVMTSKKAKRDVAGEVVTDDGKLVYKAEVLEMGKGQPEKGVASR